MRSKKKGEDSEPFTKKYVVEPKDYLKILAILSEPKGRFWRFFKRSKNNKEIITYDNSNHSIAYDLKNKKCRVLLDDVIYNFSSKRCKILASDIQISEGEIINGFFEPIAVVAKVVTFVSSIPFAIFDIVFAVQGHIISISAGFFTLPR